MKSLKKILLIGVLCSLKAMLFAADADLKQQAEQEAHPSKELICQEIVKTNLFLPVLAPMIAAYAENPGKGYFFIDKSWPPLAYEMDSDVVKKYTKNHPDLISDAAISIVEGQKEVVIIDAHVSTDILDDTLSWYFKNCPYLPKRKEPNKTNFPKMLPAKLMKNLKEGESLFITLQGVPLELVCVQKNHPLSGDHYPFQKRFKEITGDRFEEEDQGTFKYIRLKNPLLSRAAVQGR